MARYTSLTSVFAAWKLKSGAGDDFVEDGIIDDRLWSRANKKILFVLKEPGVDPTIYNKNKAHSLLELYRGWNGARYSFNYLGRVAYGIQNATKKDQPSFELASEKEHQDKAFMSTAFMNLKKTPTTRIDKSTDSKTLEEYVNKYPEYILEQIRIIGPDVVVCCGDITHSLLTQTALFKAGGFGRMIVMKTCHPTARVWRNSKGVVVRKKADGYRELIDQYQTQI